MKKFRILILLSYAATFFASCKHAETDQNSIRFKRFYSWYFITEDKNPPPDSISEDTLAEYFTASFLKDIVYVNDTERESDPITLGQDIDRAWAESLEVAKITDGEHPKYCVSFEEDPKKRDTFFVCLTKEAGAWKIDDVGVRDGSQEWTDRHHTPNP